MLIQFTNHAKNDRLNKRLLDLVTIKEVIEAVKSHEEDFINCREYFFVEVKRFNNRIYLDNIVTDDTPKGDVIVVKVCKINWNVAQIRTVMLRKSSSISAEYIAR